MTANNDSALQIVTGDDSLMMGGVSNNDVSTPHIEKQKFSIQYEQRVEEIVNSDTEEDREGDGGLSDTKAATASKARTLEH